MDVLAAALAVAVPVVVGVCLWDTRAAYGPIRPGNRRWRRELAARYAESEARERLAALTDDDRAWLALMGWRG